MLKKVISLLLAICMIFCLSACGIIETSSNTTNTPSESQTDTPQNTDEIASTETENGQVSSNTEEEKENNTQTQTPVTQSKPTSTTDQSTHTHSYSNATCTSPKTCTRCRQTSGGALGHNYVNNKCSRCGKTDPNSLPVGIEQLHVIDSGYNCSYINSNIEDTFGNKYVGYYRFYENNEPAYAIFNLNYEYSNFSCDIITNRKDATFYIYVDNILKYQTSNLSNLSGPIHVDINVKNGQQLKIMATDNIYNFETAGYLVNAQFTK